MSCNCQISEDSSDDCWSYSCCSEDSYPEIPKPEPISRPIGVHMKPPTIEVCTREECLIFPQDEMCHKDCESFLAHVVKEGGDKAKEVCEKAPLTAGCNVDYGDEMSLEDEEEDEDVNMESEPENINTFCGNPGMDVELRCKQPIESSIHAVQFIFHWNLIRADLGLPPVKEHPALAKMAKVYMESDPNATGSVEKFNKEKYGFETILEGIKFFCYPKPDRVRYIYGSGSSSGFEINPEEVVKNKLQNWIGDDLTDVGVHIKINGSLFYYILFMGKNSSNCYYQAF